MIQTKGENYPPPPPLRGTRPCLRGRKWGIALHSCNYSLPYRGGLGRGPYSILQNLYIPLCPVLGGEILVSSRLGPRKESAVNMNCRAHDNMSAPHWRCGNGNGMGTCTFSLACKERINALNISV